MKIVLLDASTLGEVKNIEELEVFGELVKYDFTTPNQTIERLEGAEVVITNKVIIDDLIISKLPELKLICVAATGMNNIDLAAAKQRGVEVKNVSGYSTKSVAQHTFTLLFGLLSKLSYYDDYVKSGNYEKSEIFTNLKYEFWEVAGKTMGIIGLGTIGKEVARLAEVFGMNVIYYSTSGKNNNSSYKRVDLNEILNISDVISIHAPLNENTEGLIGQLELNKMKKTAVLLNTGRGGIIKENELIEALNSDEIAGAALDVLKREPIEKNHPISKLKEPEKILITPHIAWASKEARYTLIDGIKENIQRYVDRK